MAANKKSFILYTDLVHTVDLLDPETAGNLFKHILAYVNDRRPQTDDNTLKIIFEPIRQQLKRDLQKWDRYINKQKENGRKGGRPTINPDNPSLTQKTQALASQPKKADSVSVNVSDSDSVNDFISIKRNFFNDFRWKEKFCNDKGLQIGDLEQKMQEFISDIELREDWKELKELKSHFTNLFNKQKNGLKPTETGGRHRGGLQLVASLKQDFAAGRKKDTGS